jgi:uncharacterized protein (UPF0332 family)
MKTRSRKRFAPVPINGTRLYPKNAIHRRKLLALKQYVSNLLASPARAQIAKIILFGSVAKGEARPESDIDVYVMGFDDLDALRDASYDAILDLPSDCHEGIEPLFDTIESLIFPEDYFTYRVTRYGKEIYTVPERQIKLEEAAGLLELARLYLASAEDLLQADRWRAVADLAYNAAELCVKGLLLFKMDDLPGSHGGVVKKFGELYARDNVLPRNLGKRLNQGLETRSLARYKPKAKITRETAEENVNLAREMINHLDTYLRENE